MCRLESLYNLLYQINAALAQSHQPFVVWRLEWVAGEADRLWPDHVPQIKNEHGAAQRNALFFARHRKRLFLQGRPVYALSSHYSQTRRHLPDYGAYHAALIADPDLPSKWQPGENVAYILVFEGDLKEGENPEGNACQMLPSRPSEALPIPVLHEGADTLCEGGTKQGLIAELTTEGDSPRCFWVHLTETVWAKLLSSL